MFEIPKFEYRNNAKIRGYSESLYSESDFKIPLFVLCSKYCPTSRDVYLRYVLGLRPKQNMNLRKGKASHEVVENVFKKAVELRKKQVSAQELQSKLQDERERIVNKIAKDSGADNVEGLKNLWESQSRFVLKNFEKILDYCSEMHVDGSKIGLSPRLKVDLFFKPMRAIVELKTGKQREYHVLTTTAYALALESMTGENVDNAFLVYLRYFNKYPVFKSNFHLIDDLLRKKIIRLRDRKTNIVLEQKDPGTCENCSPYCGYYHVCHPSVSDRFFK